ncbi:MAG: hypothetical protein RR576_00530 [Oscillospiraceae bacterium]
MTITKSSLLKRLPSTLSEKHEDYLIVLPSDKKNVIALNATSQYLLTHCNQKTVQTVCEELFLLCNSSGDLDYDTVMAECLVALQEMVNKNIIQAL